MKLNHKALSIVFSLFSLISKVRFDLRLALLAGILLISGYSNAQYLRDWTTEVHSHTGTYQKSYSDVDSAGNLYVLLSENFIHDSILFTKYDPLGAVAWQKDLDSAGTSRYSAGGLCLDSAGNVYVALEIRYGLNSHFTVMKFDSQGNRLWWSRDSSFVGDPRQMKFGPDGYLYVVGAKYVNFAMDQLATVKMDTDGNVIWSRINTLSTTNGGVDVEFDSQGNIYSAYNNSGVVKYSASGDTLWHFSTSTFITGLYAITVDPQDNVILVGTRYPAPYNVYMVKVSSTGQLLWTTNYNGPANGTDTPFDVVTDSNSNIYTVGICNYPNNGGFNNISDFLLLKHDSLGNNLFARILTGNSSPTAGADQGYRIKFGPDGMLYISGCLFNDVTSSDAFIARLDLDGNILWQDIYSNNTMYPHELFWDFHFDAAGNIYAVGESSQSQWSNWAHGIYAKYCNGYCPSLSRPNITGKVFNDTNQNCIQEQGENYLEGRMVELSGTTTAYALTDTGGNFRFYAPPGNYLINTGTMNWWVNTCTPGVSVNIANLGDSSVNNLVGSYLPPNLQDLFISLGGGLVRPGLYTDYVLHYTNQGTATTDGRVVFTYDSLMTYESAVPSPDSVLTNKLVWNFTGLAPMSSGTIDLTMRMDSAVALGLLVTPLHAVVEPVATDITPFDNIDSLYQTVIGPFDPNHKTVVPQGILEENVDTVLNYMVQFQNMGTDTAFTVVVRDTISDWLDLSTFKLGATSSPATVQFIDNIMFVRFEGANLPPDTVNYLASQGFFKYSIHLKEGVPLGTDIQNRAHIYFDYAAPVATEATHSHVGYIPEPDGVNEVTKDDAGISIYPNPFTGNFTLEADVLKASSVNIEIFDINGRSVYSSQTQMQAGKNKVNIDFDKSGIFLVRTIIDGKVSFKKIISL